LFLTERQLAVLNFIRDFIRDKGISPTLDEMSQYFGVSKITVYEHVNALERKRAIRKTRNMARAIELIEEEPPLPAPRALTVRGRVAAGAAIEAITDEESFQIEDLAPDEQDCYMLRVEGDSMIDAHICSGDLVIIRPTQSASNGEIVLAMLPDDATGGLKGTLKRFYKEKGRVRLQPANATMKPIVVDDVEVHGKVVGVVRPKV
jgi:repressor LexA